MKKKIEDTANPYKQDAYAMYLRKSRADLELEAMGEGETLARHQKILETLAARHNISMNQVTIYREIVSGDSLDERPEAQRLLADVFAKKYKAVLVVEIERLARGNTKDQGEVADAFQYSHTHIITPAKVYDPENEFDQEYFEFGLFMSRREYKTIRRRLTAGKLQSVKEGNYIPSRPPFGFDAVRISKKERVLVPREDQARIVRLVFDWYVNERAATYEIARRLTNMGIPTVRGGREWTRQTITDMLHNYHYIGKVTWGEQKTYREKDPETGKTVKRVTRTGNTEIYDGKHEAIIPEELFYAVGDIYGKNAHAKQSFELANPFAGILRCHNCGKTFNFNGYYNEGRKGRLQHPGSKFCKMKSVLLTTLTDAVISALLATIADFQIKLDADNDQQEAIKHQEMIDAMIAELKKQEARKRRLMDSWEADDGMYTRDEFIERKQMYTQTIEKLKEQIEAAKKEIPAPIDYAEKITNIHAVIDCIKNDDLTVKEKNDFLKKYIKVIYMQVEDLGHGKGCKPILDLHLL